MITLSGALVATPVAAFLLPPGLHAVTWNGLDGGGVPVPAGTYWITFGKDAEYRAEPIFKE